MLIEYKGYRIFAFSDTHGMCRRLTVPSDADTLICAGDACEGFNPAGLKDFLEWYLAILAKLRIFVHGNHGRIFNTDPTRARNLVPDGILLLEAEGTESNEIKFLSVSVRPYHKGPLSLPSDMDFLITHGPTYSYRDRDTGDKNLYLAIVSARPQYQIFGLAHEEGLKRKAMLGGTTFHRTSWFRLQIKAFVLPKLGKLILVLGLDVESPANNAIFV